jgi:cell division protein FtsL
VSVPARRATSSAPEPFPTADTSARARPAARPARPPSRAEAAPTTTTRRRRRHHVGFAIFATVVLGSMVLGIVSLNALLAQQSFRIDEAERRLEALQTEHLDLVHEQARLSAPGRIAAWARRNGMRLPDDIRSLHTFGEARSAPAGADPSWGEPGA